jgi:hypothetical protein
MLAPMQVLLEDHQGAVKAASRMFSLRPETWYISSTINNVQMILDSRYGIMVFFIKKINKT